MRYFSLWTTASTISIWVEALWAGIMWLFQNWSLPWLWSAIFTALELTDSIWAPSQSSVPITKYQRQNNAKNLMWTTRIVLRKALLTSKNLFLITHKNIRHFKIKNYYFEWVPLGHNSVKVIKIKQIRKKIGTILQRPNLL